MVLKNKKMSKINQIKKLIKLNELILYKININL